MYLDFYAISIQPTRLVATELEPADAAVLFDAAHSILLAAPTDLVRLALRYRKPLKIFSREDVRCRCHGRPPVKTRRRQACCV